MTRDSQGAGGERCLPNIGNASRVPTFFKGTGIFVAACIGAAILGIRPSHRTARCLAAVALALVTLGALACRHPASRQPNVLVLVVDALRPDHLGCYGYSRPVSPTIDGLARRGALFADVTSSASYTRAAVASIFTSVFPAGHGVLSQGKQVEVLSDEYRTRAEVLRERGYRTAACMPNPSLHRSFHFDQGFDVYDDAFGFRDVRMGQPGYMKIQETASRINRRFEGWLDREPDKPFFAYLHYRDVHAPYAPPGRYATLFTRPGGPRELDPLDSTGPVLNSTGVIRPAADDYKALYDGEIRYTDDHIGSLVERLRRGGQLADTILIVTADHGEAFGEHGSWTHGGSVYEEEVRVPLILVMPDGEHAGRRVETPVQTVDLYPTVLELLGIDLPPQVQGVSLLRPLRGEADAARAVFSEARVMPLPTHPRGGQFVAVRAGAWKLIYNRTSRQAELYHLAADPGETRDLFDLEPARARELLRLLRRFDAETVKRKRWVPGQEGLPAEVIEGLRALGYVR